MSDSICDSLPNLNGFFKGEVVHHEADGRLKVYIPGVYPYSWRDNYSKLPPCKQAMPLFGGCYHGNGMFSYPNYGTIVICIFENGDQNFPIAIATLLDGPESRSAYNNDTRCDSSENTTNIGTDAYVHVVNVDQTQIKLYETGKIEITTYDIKTPVENRNRSFIDINGDGNITISTTSKVTIDSPNIELKANTLQFTADNISVKGNKQIEVSTDHLTEKAGKDAHLISPKIDIDATAGDVNIRSKSQAPFYMY